MQTKLVRDIMETPCKILILVLFTLTLGEGVAKDDRETMTEVKEIIMDLKDELAATKNELVASKEIIMELKEKVARTEVKVIASKDEQMVIKDELANTKNELKMLEKEVAIVREPPPHLHMCGSHYETLENYNFKTITFSNLLYSSTNTEGGGLDISSGVFTSPCSGSYTVTWSTNTGTYNGHYNTIYLYKNSNQVEESLHYSANSDPSYSISEQGNNYN